MIFDKTTLLSDAQAIVATAVSTNVIDFGASGTVMFATAALVRNVGKGEKVPLLIQVVETFNNLTSLEVQVQTDDNAGFASPKQVGTTGAIVLADLVAGKIFNIDTIPRDADERYFRLNYVVVGTAPTLGKVTSGVNMGIPNNG
jgi:hypothetical protein